MLKYLSRYTHRIAISNHRLVSMDDGSVRFRWKDYAHGCRQRVMSLPAGEFLRRLLMHIVPRGFMRIRHFGFLANRCRQRELGRVRRLLAADALASGSTAVMPDSAAPREIEQFPRCPVCQQGRMVRQILKPQRWLLLFQGFNNSS